MGGNRFQSGEHIVGKSVQKKFRGYGVFTGKVVSYNSARGFYKIRYEDGDAEEVDADDVRGILVLEDENGRKRKRDDETPKRRKKRQKNAVGRPRKTPNGEQTPNGGKTPNGGEVRKRGRPRKNRGQEPEVWNTEILEGSRGKEAEVSNTGPLGRSGVKEGEVSNTGPLEGNGGKEAEVSNTEPLEGSGGKEAEVSNTVDLGRSGGKEAEVLNSGDLARSTGKEVEVSNAEPPNRKRFRRKKLDVWNAGPVRRSPRVKESAENAIEKPTQHKRRSRRVNVQNEGLGGSMPSVPQLPPSSSDLGVPEESVPNLLYVYNSLRSFSRLLFLSPFGLDDFVGALNCKSANYLLDAVHVKLLQALMKHLYSISREEWSAAAAAARCLRGDYSRGLHIEMEPKSKKRQKKDGEANCSSQPTKHKQRKHFYIYGNYHTYYGYRIDQALDEDPRMKVLKKEWFEGRDCLDIGCNEGFITISIAQKFACRNILGIDIDDKLIGRARQNLKAMAGFEENGETIKWSAEERNKVNKLEDTYRLEQSNGYEDKSNEFIVTEREEQSSEDTTNELGDADSRSLRDEVSQLFRGSGSDNLAEDKDRLNELEDMDTKGQSFEDKEVTKDLGGADSISVREGASHLLRGAGSDNLSEDKERVNELESTDTTRRSFEDKVVTKDLKCTYRRFFRHGTKQMSRNAGSDNVEGKFKDTDLLERVRFRTENFIQKSPSVLDAAYDTVLCLSVTKWIHLNWGDEGLICLFAKIWQILRPGGILLLEPQPWKSYERKRLVSEVAVENFREIIFKPDAFRDILLDKIGFRSMEMISMHVPNSTAGFNRPIFLLWK